MVKDNRRKQRPRVKSDPYSSGPVAKTAAEIAHELSNLLMSVSFSCAQLLVGIPENSPLRAVASAIARDAAEGRALSRRLGKLFGRMGRGDPVNINRIVEQVSSHLRGLVPRNVELGIVLSDTPVLVEVDSEDLERLITNLVITAGDALERGGTLTLRVERFSDEGTGTSANIYGAVKQFAKLTVEALGPVIRPDLFSQPLPPLDLARCSVGTKSMELAIVDAIVTRNEGVIEIESGAGSGAKIAILLPGPANGEASGEAGNPNNKSA
ncbi:MAG: hypothetical protein JO356_10550 [Acidobacteria bacterium]|nr:hypothetical protein [Acidobacteriota bacterium]